MNTGDFRDPFLAALHERIDAIRARARRLTFGVAIERMARKPAKGGWSAAQVFEHLAIANASYERPVDRALERSRARRGAPRAFPPTLGGGLLIRALTPGTRGVPTIRPYVPLAVRVNVVEGFLETMDEIESRMRAADGLDLRVMLSSPVMPILRLNLGEAFEVAVVHAERHLDQIERALEAAGA